VLKRHLRGWSRHYGSQIDNPRGHIGLEHIGISKRLGMVEGTHLEVKSFGPSVLDVKSYL